MAKPTQEQWDEAIRLKEAGRSLNDIVSRTGIPKSTLRDRFKKQDVKTNETAQLIVDAVRVESKIRTLETAQADFVRKEVDDILKAKQFFTNASLKNCSDLMKKINAATPLSDHLIAQKVLNEGMKGAGVVPFYPNSPVINNTNAQQENKTVSFYIPDNGRN